MNVHLIPLVSSDVDQFVRDNQEAFRYGALEEFGLRDDHFEEDGEIISADTILAAISEGLSYRIVADDQIVGGLVIKVKGNRGELVLLFVSPAKHSQGIGYSAWCQVEKMFTHIIHWETYTPYFEKRNIHFYVNRCGFSIVEFYNALHTNPDMAIDDISDDMNMEMFRFEKACL